MNKKIFLILLTILFVPILVFAQGQAIDIRQTMDDVVQLFLYVVSGIVVILWVVTGLLFLTANGDPNKLDKAKLALLASVGGTVVILLAEGALQTIGGALNIEVGQ